MKNLKNIEGRKYIVFLTICAIFFSIVTGIVTLRQNKIYKRELNEKIAEIVGELKYQYPNIEEEKIIKILNDSSQKEKGKELLDEYGISEEAATIYKIEKMQTENIIINMAISFACYMIVTVIFVIYLKRRQKKLDELDRYIQKVSQRDYSISIKESSEDELNSLKNSLYKITVMLKEDSINKQKQNEAILESVSDISHQLKTPLTSIQILIDNILESKDMDEETKKKFMLEISKQIKGMNFLILSLLKLSRLDAGVVEFEKREVKLSNVIDDVISNLEVIAEVKQIKIVKQIKNDATILGDYNWNKEAILNILKNAIEHTPAGANKKVQIILEENDVYVGLKIIDEGQGIKKEDFKNIFSRFYKAENSNENSIGIGLPLAKSIIEKQNGYISVESELGKGTTFIIKYLK